MYISALRSALFLCLSLSLVACGKSKEPEEDAGGDAGADSAMPPGDGSTSEDSSMSGTCESTCQAVADAEEECYGGEDFKQTRAYRVPALTRAQRVALEAPLGEGHLFYNANMGVLVVQDATRRQLESLERRIQADALPVHRSAHGHVLVAHGRVVAKGLSRERMRDASEALGGKLIRPLRGLPGTFLLECDDADTVDFAKRLSEVPGVAYAEPSWIRRYSRRGPINDPLTSNQWFLVGGSEDGVSPLATIDAHLAWDISEGVGDSVVAIFDDGVDVGHEDLMSHLVDGLNVPSNLDTAFDEGCCSHGTAVAGVAVANANDIGLRGVCPSCSLMPIFDMSIDVEDDSATAEAFAMACETAAVINNSWGPQDGIPELFGEDPVPPESLASVVDEAFRTCESEGRGGLGTVIVFAAGNGNEDVSDDPLASHELTLAVAAVGPDGRKADYSDFGAPISVAAPSNGTGGPGIWTTAISGMGDAPSEPNYTHMFGGTSSAAPVVAGLAGLIISVNPTLSAAEVRQIIQDTALKVDPVNGRYDENGHSRYYGYGMVNAYRAVRAAEAAMDECTALNDETCNGVDDDCDDTVDEGCSALDSCAPCTNHGECGAGAICANTPNDIGTHCIMQCDAGSCPAGTTCTAGFCIPESGRCSEPTDEVCNNIDDDADSMIDEEGCSPASDGECFSDAQCADGACFGGFCAPTCSSDADCEGDPCVARATRYGEADSTASVCDSGPPIFELCVEDFCSSEQLSEELTMCVEDSDGTCFEVADCPYIVFEGG